MQSLRESFEGRPFAVLAVNVGEGRARRATSGEDGAALPDPARPRHEATRAWSARVLPASYVIAPDGKVAYSYLGAIDWNSLQVKSALERLMPR